MRPWPILDRFSVRSAPQVALASDPSVVSWGQPPPPTPQEQRPAGLRSLLAPLTTGIIAPIVSPVGVHPPAPVVIPSTTVVQTSSPSPPVHLLQVPVLPAVQCQPPQDIAAGCMSSDYGNCPDGACQHRCIKALRDSAHGTTFAGWTGDPGYDSGICRSQNPCMDPAWRNYYCSSMHVAHRQSMTPPDRLWGKYVNVQ